MGWEANFEEGRQYLFLTDIQLMAEALDVPIVDLMREAESVADSD
jgi:transcriptional regulator with XRE-family HTH domain